MQPALSLRGNYYHDHGGASGAVTAVPVALIDSVNTDSVALARSLVAVAGCPESQGSSSSSAIRDTVGHATLQLTTSPTRWIRHDINIKRAT
jgi:hypothetical protein